MPKKKLGDNPLDMLGGKLPRHGASPWDITHPPMAYRMPREIHERVRQAAKQEGVPVGQLVAYVLQEWLARYERGEAILPIREVLLAKREVDLGT